MLVLGAVGHRNIDRDGARLTAIVEAELRRIEASYASPGLVVVSALAEGADRLIAEAAMTRHDATLVAVLPMPRPDYEIDFASAASRAQFAQLIDQAGQVIEAPLLTPGDGWRAPGEARDHQYAWGGAYVARSADILLAVWDGETARGAGGTAQTVQWFRAGQAPARYPLQPFASHRAGPRPARALVHIHPTTGRVARTAAT